MKRRIFALLLTLLLLSTSAFATLAETTEGTDSEVPAWTADASGRIALRESDASAPAGERKKTLALTLPLVALGDTALYDVTITPIVSTNLDSFPFVVDRLNYTESYARGAMQPGQTWDVLYVFQVDSYATRGVKQVDFEVSYRVGSATAALEQSTLHIFINITKGYSPSSGGTSTTVMPKLIVDSFKVDTDRIYAGETFTLTLQLRNTSETESIKNLEIQASEATGLLLPAGNGAGTMFIREILPDETISQTIMLQSAPDAEAKPYILSLRFGYDGGKSKVAYTSESSVTLPILQRVRVECDTPVSYNEPYLGSEYGMYLNIYNKGKSTVYNCEIRVEGEGVSMMEPYFGGNLSAGGMLSADFALLIEAAGQLTPEIVVSYEDIYGEVMENRFPLDLYVMDGGTDLGFDDGISVFPDVDGMEMYPDDMETKSPGGSKLLLLVLAIGGGLLVLAAAIVIIVVIRRKRSRTIADF